MNLNDIGDLLQLIKSETEGSRKIFNFWASMFFDFALLICKGSSNLTTDTLNNNKNIQNLKETSTNEIETSLKNTRQLIKKPKKELEYSSGADFFKMLLQFIY